ncbi:MAG: translesion error-prone DNA polymerase V autoproteolytic subunit [Muribaculaceae bacterium]|nr:translesion error-prone DNA polymerase V autoproteolytic subunit [Muribaculaceae bacterium]
MRLEIYGADVTTELELPFADGGVRAGFPSPAQDYITASIDLNRELVKHPASTFYARVEGDSMIEEGIDEGDILLVDKSVEPEDGDLAVCCLNGEFTLKRLRFGNGRRISLMPSNKRYRPIEISEDDNFMVWGIVLFTIKANRRRRLGSEIW